MSGIPLPEGAPPPPPPPPFESPYPAYYTPFGVPPQPPPPFYGWGPAPPPPPEPDQPYIPYQDPTYPQHDQGHTVDNNVFKPPTPPTKAELKQQALDMVEAAALAVINSSGGLTGVKRKALATDLLSTNSGSYHLGWTSHWLTPMPPEILCMCKPLHCELCECHATSPLQAKMHYEGRIHDKHVKNFFSNWEDNFKKIIPEKHPDFDSKKKQTISGQ